MSNAPQQNDKNDPLALPYTNTKLYTRIRKEANTIKKQYRTSRQHNNSPCPPPTWAILWKATNEKVEIRWETEKERYQNVARGKNERYRNNITKQENKLCVLSMTMQNQVKTTPHRATPHVNHNSPCPWTPPAAWAILQCIRMIYNCVMQLPILFQVWRGGLKNNERKEKGRGPHSEAVGTIPLGSSASAQSWIVFFRHEPHSWVASMVLVSIRNVGAKYS